MKKTRYEDQDFALIEASDQISGIEPVGIYTHYVPSNGAFVLVLGFKKYKGRYLYLASRQNIPGWDEHPDLCGLSAPAVKDAALTGVDLLKNAIGIEVNLPSLVPLGVCAASKWSDDTYYLFSIDLTGNGIDELPEPYIWTDEEAIFQSLDAQLAMAVSRLKLVP